MYKKFNTLLDQKPKEELLSIFETDITGQIIFNRFILLTTI